MAASAARKAGARFLPVFLAAGIFATSFLFPHATFANTTYGAGTYGSGNYGGLFVDITAPVISAISSGTPGQTSVTITWTTDENANSHVDLGLNTTYGTASTSATLATSHAITITGLTANTTYHFRIQSTDGSSNTGTSADQTFTTASVPDTTAPTISSISSGTPGQTTATITWTTNEAATSTIRYGLTTSYSSASTSASLVTSHSITLTNLTAATTYHFQVGSADSSNNAAVSSDQTFTTASVPDTTVPTVSLTAPSAGATISGSGVSLTATASDNVAVAGVTFYADSMAIGGEDTTTTYGVTLDSTALSNGTHSLVAVARDTSNNRATSTAVSVTVNNTAPDTTAPTIGGINSGTPSMTMATIHWTTNEAASSTIRYGLTTSYSNASTSSSFVTSHALTLTGLTANTTYHYQISSADASGNVATSADQTFTTAAADTTAPVVSNISSGSPEEDSATITWTTDEPAGSTVNYGTTETYGSQETSGSLVTSHSIALSDLDDDTEYHFQIVTADSLGNTSTTSDQTFTTDEHHSSGSHGGGGGGSSGSSVPSTTTTTTTTTTSSGSTVPPASSFARDLDVASTGSDVTILQSFLIGRGYLAAGNTTGYFGVLTQAALARFQAASGISPAAGYFGTITRTYIASLGAGTVTSIPVTVPTVPVTVPSGTVATSFARDLDLGSTGEDVRTLQVWLNDHGYAVAISGPGAPGSETTMFGYATQAALARYQSAKGITPAAGYFGAITRAAIDSNF